MKTFRRIGDENGFPQYKPKASIHPVAPPDGALPIWVQWHCTGTNHLFVYTGSESRAMADLL